MVRALSLAMAGGLMLALGACGNGGDQSPAAIDASAGTSTPAGSDSLPPLSPAQSVTVGAVAGMSAAGIYIALDQGYFSDLGLDVKVTKFQNLGQLAAPLGAGRIDVGGGGLGPGLWNTVARGIDLKAVATQGAVGPGHSYSAFYVSKGSSIQSCADVRGKNIAFAAKINAGVHTGALWLKSCGLTYDDVHMKIMGFGDMITALKSGSIDVAHMIEPIGAVARMSGSVRQLIADSEVRSTQQGVLEYSPQFAEKKDLANRFMVAYARAIDFYNENWKPDAKPSDELAKVLIDAGAVPSRAVLDEVVPPLLQQYGEMDLAAAKSDYEYFKEQKTFEDASVPFDAAIDTSFTDFAKAYLSKG